MVYAQIEQKVRLDLMFMLSAGHLIDQRCNSWNCSSGRRLGRRLDWSAWVDLNHRSPASKAGGDGQAPLHAGATRWLPDQDSNLDLPGNNRGSYRWTIGENLVEHLGLEPSFASLQGRPADPARAPMTDAWSHGVRPSARAVVSATGRAVGSDPIPGAWGRFRAHLSAASARRCHQTSYPGETRDWCGRRESNSRPRGGSARLCH